MSFIRFQRHVFLFAVLVPLTTRFASMPWRRSRFRRGEKNAHGLLCGLLVAICLAGAGKATAEEGRGEMLYQNHCIACHTTQVHWRDQRLAKDWPSLRAQVRRWERNTGLSWNDDDVEAVSGYLNRLYYQFPDQPKDRVISLFNSDLGTRNKEWRASSWQAFSDRK